MRYIIEAQVLAPVMFEILQRQPQLPWRKTPGSFLFDFSACEESSHQSHREALAIQAIALSHLLAFLRQQVGATDDPIVVKHQYWRTDPGSIQILAEDLGKTCDVEGQPQVASHLDI